MVGRTNTLGLANKSAYGKVGLNPHFLLESGAKNFSALVVIPVRNKLCDQVFTRISGRWFVG